MTDFKDEIENLIGVRPSSWSLFGGSDMYACVWFEYTPSPDRPRGQPIRYEQLQTLDAEYGVASVQSDSNGRTDSKLRVTLENP